MDDRTAAFLRQTGLIPTSAAARTLGVKTETLYAYVSRGQLTAHRASDSLDEDPPSPHAADPDEVLWLRDALATLDEDDREILMLREYEQLSYQEIADVRGTPLNTVRSQLFRARMALKDALEARAPQPARRSHVSR